MESFHGFPHHDVHTAKQQKESAGRYERLRMCRRVYQSIRYVKQQSGRINQYVPGIPAQIPAEIDRETTKQQNACNNFARVILAYMPDDSNVDNKQTDETKD